MSWLPHARGTPIAALPGRSAWLLDVGVCWVALLTTWTGVALCVAQFPLACVAFFLASVVASTCATVGPVQIIAWGAGLVADCARRTLHAHWLLASTTGCFALALRVALCASRAFVVQPFLGAIQWLAGKGVLAVTSPARAVCTWGARYRRH